MAEVEELYYRQYWLDGRCDRVAEVSPALARLHFDGCVNLGIKPASQLLQRAVGATADGIIGPLTLAAARAAVERDGAPAVVSRLLELRRDKYRALATANPAKFGPHLSGWLNRMKVQGAKVLRSAEAEVARLTRSTFGGVPVWVLLVIAAVGCAVLFL